VSGNIPTLYYPTPLQSSIWPSNVRGVLEMSTFGIPGYRKLPNPLLQLMLTHWLTTCRKSGCPSQIVVHFSFIFQPLLGILASAKNISVRAEWLRQSGRTPSEPSETPRWRNTPRPASIPRVALHIAVQSQFRRFFLRLCKSILRCSWKHLQLWRCIQDAMRFDY